MIDTDLSAYSLNQRTVRDSLANNGAGYVMYYQLQYTNGMGQTQHE